MIGSYNSTSACDAQDFLQDWAEQKLRQMDLGRLLKHVRIAKYNFEQVFDEEITL